MKQKENPRPLARGAGADQATERVEGKTTPAREGWKASLDTARAYIARNWNPVPIPYRKKGPKDDAWQHLRITAENVDKYFDSGPQNIGVQLGKKSGGLTDVDLDCAEAIALARDLLPPTSAVFGRASKPRSHWLYYADDAENVAAIKLTDADKKCIIELRLGGGDKGAQTIFPGSTHESGEAIEWASDGEPARSSCAILKTAVTKIAVGVILMRSWPAKGSRHDAALVLGGFLARAGWEVNDIGDFVEIIAREAGSQDPAARRKDAIDAAEAHARGENVYGLPGLSEIFGEAEAKKIAKLLEYREPAQPPLAARGLSWRECRTNARPIASLFNARLAITALDVECRYDLFHDKILIGYRGNEVQHEIRQLVGEFTDNGLTRLRQMASERFGFDPSAMHLRDAVNTLALERRFDPVLDMLDAAQSAWDKKQRLDSWVVDYLSCEDTPLNRAIGRKVLIAAVRRAREPGCKFDNITVLESPEGKNKSTAIRILAGDENFSDQSLLGVRDKEVQEQLSGIWMHENADLAGMRRADVEHVKAFASRQTDRARPAYGRVREDRKRRSIEWGTTNNDEYLQSQSGNRRFWPLATGTINIETLKRDRLQLLGEAATYEGMGESVVLDEVLWAAASAAQEERRAKDPWEDILANIPATVAIFDKEGKQTNTVKIIHIEHEQERVASRDLLEHVLKIPPSQQSRTHDMRLAAAMKVVGWQRNSNGKVQIGKEQVRGYWRRQVM